MLPDRIARAVISAALVWLAGWCPLAADIVAGTLIAKPATLDAGGLDPLLGKVADGINPAQIGKHGGDFETYYALCERGRAGKVFEAVVADRANPALAKDGRSLLVTAAEGAKHDPADLVMAVRSESGWLITAERYQLKLGYSAVKSAIGDARYAGMRIVTTKDVVEAIEETIRRETIRNAGRGLGLSPEAAALKEALDSGRILRNLPGGAPLPTEAEVLAICRTHTEGLWIKLAKAAGFAGSAPGTVVPAVAEEALIGIRLAASGTGAVTEDLLAANRTRRFEAVLGRTMDLAGRAICVADLAYSSYQMAVDFQGLQSGAITVEEFALRNVLRATRMVLEVAFMVDPEPISKIGLVVATITVAAAEMVGDHFIEAGRSAREAALMELETETRYAMVREMVLER
ncbi:MAG: hypothetical protein J0M04_18655 [Verrucomicrobia bacterium]|nr:hypothetical protein [Verrucomicrobiota bacterium]